MLRNWWVRLALVLGLAIGGSMAAGQSLQDNIIGQLRDQGFTRIEVSHTLLGRLHILAFSETYRREIVINPNSGEILRDYITALDGGGVAPLLVAPVPSVGSGSAGGGQSSGGQGSGGHGSDPNDDDDDDDDRDDDERDDDDDDDDGDDDDD